MRLYKYTIPVLTFKICQGRQYQPICWTYTELTTAHESRFILLKMNSFKVAFFKVALSFHESICQLLHCNMTFQSMETGSMQVTKIFVCDRTFTVKNFADWMCSRRRILSKSGSLNLFLKQNFEQPFYLICYTEEFWITHH